MKSATLIASFALAAFIALPSFASAQVYPAYTLPPSPSYCPQLSANLYRGMSDYYSGGQVSQLQQFLSVRGYYQPVTGFYGSLTASNVAQFQREQGVYPITGGVGPLTRAAIARFCGGTPPYPYPNPTAPTITSVSGPTQLTVGQTGTWSVNVSDASQYLMYGVSWGDELYPNYGAALSPATMTTGSLSHAYSRAGTYTVTFTVTNAYGASAKSSMTVVVTDAAPSASTFYLGSPFTLGVSQTATQYQGQLQVTLDRINTAAYYPWGSGAPTSASVTLGQGCAPGMYCIALWYPTQSADLTLGQSTTFMGYTVTLTALTATGATFTVTSGTPSSGNLTVTAPVTSTSVSRGGALPISWQSSIKVAGSVVLDLYTASGSKVGTIAIQTYGGNGSYTWTVPTPNTVCTMQYPNGLCGTALSGQYFIKASIVSGSGFDANPTTFASGNSGTFTVN